MRSLGFYVWAVLLEVGTTAEPPTPSLTPLQFFPVAFALFLGYIHCLATNTTGVTSSRASCRGRWRPASLCVTLQVLQSWPPQHCLEEEELEGSPAHQDTDPGQAGYNHQGYPVSKC